MSQYPLSRGLLPVLVLLFAGCSSALSRPTRASSPGSSSSAAPSCDPSRDRQAILAMAGAYRVKFDFSETVALTPGYQLKPPYKVSATEKVIVAEDTPGRVVLQHILAIGEGKDRQAMKHWRQDWTFEAAEVLEYRSDSWARRQLTADERRCAWVQEVFGIEDGPRYGSWGRWVHQAGISSWSSQDTWRPLPRRESKRQDYDVIAGINRHTITAAGWIHEQDNGKLSLQGEPRLLVRERGVIPYDRAPDEDFRAIDEDWKQNAAFWAEVRQAWRQVIAARELVLFLPEASVPRSLNADLRLVREKAAPASSEAQRQQRLQQVRQVIESHLAPDRRLAGR